MSLPHPQRHLNPGPLLQYRRLRPRPLMSWMSTSPLSQPSSVRLLNSPVRLSRPVPPSHGNPLPPPRPLSLPPPLYLRFLGLPPPRPALDPFSLSPPPRLLRSSAPLLLSSLLHSLPALYLPLFEMTSRTVYPRPSVHPLSSPQPSARHHNHLRAPSAWAVLQATLVPLSPAPPPPTLTKPDPDPSGPCALALHPPKQLLRPPPPTLTHITSVTPTSPSPSPTTTLTQPSPSLSRLVSIIGRSSITPTAPTPRPFPPGHPLLPSRLVARPTHALSPSEALYPSLVLPVPFPCHASSSSLLYVLLNLLSTFGYAERRRG